MDQIVLIIYGITLGIGISLPVCVLFIYRTCARLRYCYNFQLLAWDLIFFICLLFRGIQIDEDSEYSNSEKIDL